MVSSAAVIVSKAIPAAPISNKGSFGDFLISLQALHALIRTTTEIEIVARKTTAGAPRNMPGKDEPV